MCFARDFACTKIKSRWMTISTHLYACCCCCCFSQSSDVPPDLFALASAPGSSFFHTLFIVALPLGFTFHASLLALPLPLTVYPFLTSSWPLFLVFAPLAHLLCSPVLFRSSNLDCLLGAAGPGGASAAAVRTALSPDAWTSSLPATAALGLGGRGTRGRGGREARKSRRGDEGAAWGEGTGRGERRATLTSVLPFPAPLLAFRVLATAPLGPASCSGRSVEVAVREGGAAAVA